jgi:hypothetical protein
MQSRFRNGLVAAAVAVVVATSAVGVVSAASPAPVAGGPAGSGPCAAPATVARGGATVADLRAFGGCEIDRRLTTLGQLSSIVAASRGLTPSDAAALAGEIGADTSGLTSLKVTIEGQSAIASLRAEIVEIVNKYRVYVLLGPQIPLVIAADSVLALKPHFDQIAASLTDRIARAQAAGQDVTSAVASLAAMNAAVTTAVSLASPLPAQLLALTPAAFAGSATTVLQNARTALASARDDLKAAAQDGRDVLADLK